MVVSMLILEMLQAGRCLLPNRRDDVGCRLKSQVSFRYQPLEHSMSVYRIMYHLPELKTVGFSKALWVRPLTLVTLRNIQRSKPQTTCHWLSGKSNTRLYFVLYTSHLGGMPPPTWDLFSHLDARGGTKTLPYPLFFLFFYSSFTLCLQLFS